MRSHRAMAPAVLGVALGLGAFVRASSGPHVPVPVTVDRPGDTLPIVRSVQYRMAGHVRPLLFWIGRDRVGAGQITWRRGSEGEVAYELLIGTDPEIAPRSANRWGYLAEEVKGSGGRVLGVIVSSDDEQSLDDTQGRLDEGVGGNVFKAIRAAVHPSASVARISTLRAQRELTYHDLDAALALAHLESDRAEPREVARPPGTRSGFLAAMGELLHESVQALAGPAPPGAVALHRPRAYVYGDKLHDVTLRSHRLHDRRQIGDRDYERVIKGDFQTRSRSTGKVFKFELVYGTHGPYAEVPVWIRYQPRWWLRVELMVDEDDAGPVVDPSRLGSP